MVFGCIKEVVLEEDVKGMTHLLTAGKTFVDRKWTGSHDLNRITSDLHYSFMDQLMYTKKKKKQERDEVTDKFMERWSLFTQYRKGSIYAF